MPDINKRMPAGESELKSPGFIALNITQFLGAFNDNGFKTTVSLYLMSKLMAQSNEASYVAMATALFIMPFILFSTYCGYYADKYSKRSIIIFSKYFELVIMSFGLAAFYLQNVTAIFIVLFLLGTQASVFSPAKYGILPEMLPAKDLSKANGYIELITFIAIIFGTLFGSALFAFFKSAAYAPSIFFVALSVIGIISAHYVTKVKPAGVSRGLKLNFISDVYYECGRISGEKSLMLVLAAITYFWFLAAAVQNNILVYSKEMMNIGEAGVGILLASLSIGIGLGSGMAGKLSGETIEFGLVPAGAILMIAFLTDLGFAYASMFRTCFDLFMIGMAGGLFIVPLNSYIQKNAPGGETGRILGLLNFMANSFIVVSSATVYFLHDIAKLDSAMVFIAIAFTTLFTSAYIIKKLPDFLLRFIFFVAANVVYRINVSGRTQIPSEKAALIASNHVSLADSFLINAVTRRHVRFMLARRYYESSKIKWLFNLMKVILIDGPDPSDEEIGEAREALKSGEVVCVYPEHYLSGNHKLSEFKFDLNRLTRGEKFEIIPIYISGMRGSIFSEKCEINDCKHLWPRRVTLEFADAITEDESADINIKVYEALLKFENAKTAAE